ncbi:DNA internalization-related competence protein ComEC/Rec2 [Thauera linaloolentis]|nr:DNA internalization-related competence protein ComEC/Rec2 [Thauera linaloolentis]MCM8565822.1 DNA internalization-related competence protein ComEC/Rec2 [Thauera linaloolentis]
MRALVLCFAAGVVLLQGRESLPDAAMLGLPGAGLALVLLLFRARREHVAAGRASAMRRLARGLALAGLAFILGFGWAALRADWRLADELRGELEGVDIGLTGFVAGLPQPLDEGVRFHFEPDGEVEGVPGKLLLSWYRARGTTQAPPVVKPGERWRFTVRLKRPHGFHNPGGFDYEAWLLERGLRATGYVRGGAQRLDADAAGPMDVVHRLRDAVRERFAAVLGDAPYAGILVALVIGEQRGIPPGQWEVFRRTGVAHLVAISGMHITLAAAIAGGSLGWIWRRIPGLVLRCPVRRAQALAAVLAGTGYALLAGLGIPVQRALIMLFVVAVALYRGRFILPSRVLALALLAVLVLDPWACLSAGFWLSFGAVAAIGFMLGGRRDAVGGWRAALRVQLGISLALLPLLVMLFQSLPLLSPLANAVAIPLVNFIITPFALLAALLPLDFLLQWGHQATALMMVFVEWLAAFEPGYWRQPAPPMWLGTLAMAAAAGALLPRGTPGRMAALVALAGLLAWPAPRPGAGAFVARVLDVGQGLAVHVQTEKHELMFDTGPPYGAHADAGARVVLPYLQALGVVRLDGVVLSHDDSDHVGGAGSIAAAMEVDRWWSSGKWALAAHTAAAAGPCLAGQRWRWDGVDFEFLHPAAEAPELAGKRHDNDRSCVLRVANAAGTLLLLGDVETTGEEAMLLRHGGEKLAADVVVSAHHGSRSSSSPALVDATLPQAVIHAVGHRNPFGHPHPEVWARWAGAGARNWRTDSQGAVEAWFPADADAGVSLTAQRLRAPRYWHGR